LTRHLIAGIEYYKSTGMAYIDPMKYRRGQKAHCIERNTVAGLNDIQVPDRRRAYFDGDI
jgi:hypothetical protein